MELPYTAKLVLPHADNKGERSLRPHALFGSERIFGSLRLTVRPYARINAREGDYVRLRSALIRGIPRECLVRTSARRLGSSITIARDAVPDLSHALHANSRSEMIVSMLKLAEFEGSLEGMPFSSVKPFHRACHGFKVLRAVWALRIAISKPARLSLLAMYAGRLWRRIGSTSIASDMDRRCCVTGHLDIMIASIGYGMLVRARTWMAAVSATIAGKPSGSPHSRRLLSSHENRRFIVGWK